MHKDHYRTKHHRGSSPPFQESHLGFDDWAKGLRSIDLHSEDSLNTQLLEQRVDPEIELPDYESGWEYHSDHAEGDEEFRREYE